MAIPRGALGWLQCVIVVFPDTNLLFMKIQNRQHCHYLHLIDVVFLTKLVFLLKLIKSIIDGVYF